jgi:hypothetical protein
MGKGEIGRRDSNEAMICNSDQNLFNTLIVKPADLAKFNKQSGI